MGDAKWEHCRSHVSPGGTIPLAAMEGLGWRLVDIKFTKSGEYAFYLKRRRKEKK